VSWKTPLVHLALFSILFAPAFSAEAQQPKNIRIGYLSPLDPVRDFARAEAVRLALRQFGYIEGQNTSFEYRYAERKFDRLPALAAELVRLHVHIIVASGGTVTAQAAKSATSTVPIIMTGGGLDPVEAGLIESLARPGGNVTGVTQLTRDLSGKRLELVKAAVPSVARIAAFYEPALPSNIHEVKVVLPAAARGLGLAVQSWGVRDADAFEPVFTKLSKDLPDALYVVAAH
jgi:putative tryptophan/tyrosine transport system substrate-binding protein